MDILFDLRNSDAQGIAPPQNWTTRAADEIQRLRAENETFRTKYVTRLAYESAQEIGRQKALEQALGRIRATVIVEGEAPEKLRSAIEGRVADLRKETAL